MKLNRRRKFNRNKDAGEIGCEDEEWMEVAQNRVQQGLL
jgi:hypothetical protein